MFRSTIRRLRRTLSFRSGNKQRRKTAKEGENQNWENDSVNIKGQGGCSFPVKYLGCLEVSESRGTQVCSQAAHQMKMSSAGKKKHRVTLWVTEDTLRVIDDETKSLVVDQVIEKVSFCTPDPHDEKLFSYICRDGTSRRWLCHSFKGIKDTGERISHAVGCAFAACLAKKQQQNQTNQNFQRGNSTRKTIESRANGVKLPQQSVDTLAKLNQDEYNERVQKVNSSLATNSSQSSNTASTPAKSQENENASNPQPKQSTQNNFARPRPSVGMDAAAFSRHHSLPYRTKKSTGSTTYQALTEDPLPPRIPATPTTAGSQNEKDQVFWANQDENRLLMTTSEQQANPFNAPPPLSINIQQQSGITQAPSSPGNPFVNNWNNSPSNAADVNMWNPPQKGYSATSNPFNEKFV